MKKSFLGAFTVILLVSAPVYAQVVASPRTISVSGDAKEMMAPDQAVISISIVSEKQKLEAAKEDNDNRVGKLVEVAKRFNIDREKINTSQVSIQPKYNYTNGQQQFDGYTVNRSFVITLDKIENVEKVITAITEAKLDRVNNVEFTLKDPKAAGDRLRSKAFAEAKAKAEVLANAAGGKLGKVVSINTGGDVTPNFPRPMMAMARMEKGMAADASVAQSLPGQVEQSQNLSVVFELEY